MGRRRKRKEKKRKIEEIKKEKMVGERRNGGKTKKRMKIGKKLETRKGKRKMENMCVCVRVLQREALFSVCLRALWRWITSSPASDQAWMRCGVCVGPRCALHSCGHN